MMMRINPSGSTLRKIQGIKSATPLLNEKWGKVLCGLGILMAIAILNINPKPIPDRQDMRAAPEVEIITVPNGYGYQILCGDTVIIRQEFIPVIPGRKPFASSSQALDAANLVKHKLVNHESPGISITELKMLQIIN